jgi:hypothetical protein
MKLTKSQLKQIIKEELEAVVSEANGNTISVDLTQEEANTILLALEALKERPSANHAVIDSLYDRVFDAGLGSGFGG